MSRGGRGVADPTQVDSRASSNALEALTDELCIRWLWSKRLNTDGEHADCPSCGTMRRFHLVRGRGSFSCDSCGYHIFPRVGTLFERSRIPLKLWFAAIYELHRDPHLDANTLASRLGTTQPRAKRMRDRIVTEAQMPIKSDLVGIAETVGAWDRQWNTSGGAKQSERGEQDATRMKILRATVQVIVSRGYSAVRVSDVATEAGVSTATIHYHFQTKYELLFAALSDAMRSWYEPAIIDSAADPISKLGAALGHAIIDSPDRVDQIVWMDFASLALRDVRWAAELEELCLAWDRRLRDIIQDGVDRGYFACLGSVDDAVMRIQGLIDGLAERVMLAYSDSPPERMQRLVAEAAAIELHIDAAEILAAMPKRAPKAGGHKGKVDASVAVPSGRKALNGSFQSSA